PDRKTTQLAVQVGRRSPLSLPTVPARGNRRKLSSSGGRSPVGCVESALTHRRAVCPLIPGPPLVFGQDACYREPNLMNTKEAVMTEASSPVRVNLGARSYDILLASDASPGLGPFARQRHRGALALIVTDEHVVPHAQM